MKIFARDLPIWKSDAHSPPLLLLSKSVSSVCPISVDHSQIQGHGTSSAQTNGKVQVKENGGGDLHKQGL